MNIFLCRHGNTFKKGEKIIRVGCKNDLMLTGFGLEQAKNIAAVFKKKSIKPAAVYCAPLQRTRRSAKIICEALVPGSEPRIDERLNELDYGEWSGLTDQEISDKFGAEELHDWNTSGIWPKSGVFGSNEKSVIEEVRSFAEDLKIHQQRDDTVIAVSSNGRLRYFLKLIDKQFKRHAENGNLKVRTGAMCQLVYSNKTFVLEFWDLKPEEFLARCG